MNQEIVEKWFVDVEPENEIQKAVLIEFAQVFEDYVQDKDAVISKEERVKRIQAKLEPEFLFQPAVLMNVSIFARVHEQLNNMAIKPNPDVRPNTRYPLKVAFMIYPGDEFKVLRDQAVSLVKDWVASKNANAGNNNVRESIANTTTTNAAGIGTQDTTWQVQMLNAMEQLRISMERMSAPQVPVIQAPVPEATGTRTRAHQYETRSSVHKDISAHFKTKESKYGGTEEENLQEFITEYSLTANDASLTRAQKFQYLHYLFKGEALRFYNTEVREAVDTYPEAICAMMRQFNSVDRQQRVKVELLSLSLTDFTEKNKGSVMKGLSSLAAYISLRAPQCPPDFRNEAHKVEFLRKAVLRYDWAKPVLYKVNSETKYQAFYTELANALQVHDEVAELTEVSTSKASNARTGSKPFIMFTAPRYAKQIPKTLFPGSKLDPNCWNCGKTGHRFNKCFKTLDMTAIAANKAAYFDKKDKNKSGSKRVLYEMATGLNSLLELDTRSPEDDNPSAAYFGDCDTSSSDSSDEDAIPTNFSRGEADFTVDRWGSDF